jgi:hypothetical protein
MAFCKSITRPVAPRRTRLQPICWRKAAGSVAVEANGRSWSPPPPTTRSDRYLSPPRTFPTLSRGRPGCWRRAGTLKGRDVACADTARGGRAARRPCEGLPPGSIIHREAAAQRAVGKEPKRALRFRTTSVAVALSCSNNGCGSRAFDEGADGAPHAIPAYPPRRCGCDQHRAGRTPCQGHPRGRKADICCLGSLGTRCQRHARPTVQRVGGDQPCRRSDQLPTSIGFKNELTASAEAQARVGHDITAHATWRIPVHRHRSNQWTASWRRRSMNAAP